MAEGQVGAAIAVEVTGGDADWISAGAVRIQVGEDATAVVQKNVNGVVAIPRHHNVELPIAVQIGEPNFIGRGGAVEIILPRLERAVAVASHHVDGVVSVVRRYDVHLAVASHVADGNRARVRAGGKVRDRLITAIAVAKENSGGRTAVVDHGKVGLVVMVEVPDGHGFRVAAH